MEHPFGTMPRRQVTAFLLIALALVTACGCFAGGHTLGDQLGEHLCSLGGGTWVPQTWEEPVGRIGPFCTGGDRHLKTATARPGSALFVIASAHVAGAVVAPVESTLDAAAAVAIDGQPPAIGPTTWSFDLTTRADRTVAETFSVNPTAKSTGGLSGSVAIDAAICLEYPIGGSLTFNLGTEVVTVELGPDCNGGIDPQAAPGDVLTYSYGNPASPAAARSGCGSSSSPTARMPRPAGSTATPQSTRGGTRTVPATPSPSRPSSTTASDSGQGLQGDRSAPRASRPAPPPPSPGRANRRPGHRSSTIIQQYG